MEEGCLSLPQYWKDIKRSKKIKFKATGIDGKKIKIKARGFLARVLQHEVDHLNGLLIKDRLNEK
jgi:peptide deformylase